MKLDVSVVGEVCNLIFRILAHLKLSIYPNLVSRPPPTSAQIRDLRSNRIGMMDWLDSANEHSWHYFRIVKPLALVGNSGISDIDLAQSR